MQEKRLSKEKSLREELARYETVKVYGNKSARTAIICWGSNKGVCVEIADELNLKVIQPLCLSPFPLSQIKEAAAGAKKLIVVESNATGQLARLMSLYGFGVDKTILKYDGRPFSVEELEANLRKMT
ncbi:MAG: pyruvate ferredoxin oxidoreductase, partial [Candidatus Omnitrophica bacterium]|nr:pyruvate ferredoxin oxidoreductase [Candidatus Omnitrophota bacterium]